MPTINGTNGNDLLNGTADDDVVLARGGSDIINAGGGNDVIYIAGSPNGSDTIDGGSGFDTVILDASYASFVISQVGGSLVLTAGGVTETITNVEQIGFSDRTIFIVGTGGFSTIQAAIDGAPDGATILIASGTYVEQISINGRSNLEIMAIPGATVTIQAPSDVTFTGLSSSGRDINAVVTVNGSTNIVFSNIDVNGAGVGNTIDEGPGAGAANFVGVFYRNSSGGLNNVDITGVRNPYEAGTTAGGNPVVSGVQTGVGLQVDNDTLLAFFMHAGSITDFQKNATVFNRANLDIDGVTITGGGAQPINAQNGIQVLNSTGTITGSTITDIGYAGPADAYSGGILAYGNTNLNITNNIIAGSNDESTAAKVVGIYIFDFGPDNSGGSVTGNTITHVDVGIDVSGDLGPNPITIANNDVTLIDGSDPYAAGLSYAPSGSTNDNIQGTAGDDYISTGAGSDVIDGLGGNDIFEGGTGNDSITGGLGSDTSVYAGSISGYSYVTTFDGNGMATGFTAVTQTSSGDVDTLVSIERLQFGDATLDVGAAVQLRDSGGQLVGTFTTIQAAINAAGNNATILITQNGTYTEQLTVNGKTGLTITTLPGANVTVAAPSNLAVNGTSDYYGDNVRAVIAVTDSTNVNISGITVDGNFAGDTTPGSNGDELTGIAYLNATGVVNDVDIMDVSNSTGGGLFGLQHGSGFFVDNTDPSGNDAVSFTNSTISGFQKTGALIVGADITFTGNTITGVGATILTAQNGIQLAQSSGTVNGNTISGIGYTVPPMGTYYYASGIIAYEPDGPLAMDGNTITGVGSAGEFTALDLSDTLGIAVSFQNNVISNATNGIVAYSYLGDGIGLDTNPNFTGTTFSGITGQGIFFDPELSYAFSYSTANSFNVTGTAFSDTLAGSDGDDTFSGGGGDDLLRGGGGDDILNGGLGSDSARYLDDSSAFTYMVTLDANGFITGFTAVTNTGNGDVDTLSSIETLIFNDLTFSITDPVQLFDGSNNFIGSYQTIQEAIGAANDGWVIRVAEGIYAEDVNVNKAVIIYGINNGDAATAPGRDPAAGTGEATVIGNWQITASGSVTIDGLRFVNDATTSGGAGNPVLSVLTGGGVGGHQIVNNIFWSTVVGAATDDRAIQISPIASGTVTISDNLISGSQQGLFGTASWGRGIWSDGGGVTVVIDDNAFSWTRTALNVDNSGGTLTQVTNNNFTNSGSGVSVGLASAGLTLSNNTNSNVGTDFNFRNLTNDIVFDASTATTVSPAVPANPANDVMVILGGSGNDQLTGTAGADYIDGNNHPTLGSAADNDILNGGGGNDMLLGRAGDDQLNGGTGDDGLLGGTGTDTVVYSGTVTVNDISLVADANPYVLGDQAGWVVNGGLEGSDTLDDVEIVSSAGTRILLVGNGGFATVQDAVNAASDGDIILLGAGAYAEDVDINKSVTIYGANRGEEGAGMGRDAAGGTGETTIIGNWRITAAGNVTIDGLRFVNDATTTGGVSNAPLWVLTGGGVGGHQIVNNIFWSTIVGAANDDRAIQVSPIAAGTVTISDNLISGTQQGLFGTASWGRGIWSDGGGVTTIIDDNVFSWTRTALNLDNSGGSVTNVTNNDFTNAGTGVSVGLTNAGITFSGNTAMNVGSDFNFRNLTVDVVFNAATAATMIPAIPANPGNDVVVILGGSGNDEFTGTEGADFIDGNNHPSLGAAADNDTLYGLGGNDILLGRAGDDLIYGGNGDDTVDGGAGMNLLYGEGGNDRLVVTAGSAGTIVDGGANTDTLVVTGSTTLGDVVAMEAIELQGGANLTLTGAQFATFNPGSQLSGNGVITVNMASTDLELNGQFLSVLGGSTVSFVINGSSANDLIKGSVAASNTINGGAGSDSIRGGNVADTIIGGFGDDKIYAAGGADILTGGSGADQFRYLSATDSGLGAAADRITDFAIGTDKFNFLLIDADAATAGDQAFDFIGTAAFANTGIGQIRFLTSGADLIVQADVDGNGVADMEIILQGRGGQVLTAGDFFL